MTLNTCFMTIETEQRENHSTFEEQNKKNKSS